MESFNLFEWLENLLISFSDIGDWLVTPLGNGLPSPLMLTLTSGLLIYLGFAIFKWFSS